MPTPLGQRASSTRPYHDSRTICSPGTASRRKERDCLEQNHFLQQGLCFTQLPRWSTAQVRGRSRPRRARAGYERWQASLHVLLGVRLVDAEPEELRPPDRQGCFRQRRPTRLRGTDLRADGRARHAGQRPHSGGSEGPEAIRRYGRWTDLPRQHADPWSSQLGPAQCPVPQAFCGCLRRGRTYLLRPRQSSKASWRRTPSSSSCSRATTR